MSVVAIGGDRPAGRHAGRRLRLALLLAASAAGAALSVVILRESGNLRTFEAWLSGHIVPSLTGIPSGPVPRAPIVWFAEEPHQYRGMFVSPECAVDTLIIPFVLGTTWVAWHQARLVRPLAALAIAICLLFGMNQIRLLVIIVLTVHWGYGTGFYWGHTFTGSLITLFGCAFIFFVYVLVGVRRRRFPRARHRRSQVSHPPI